MSWRDLGVVIAVSGVLILASMALVSLRNRHRVAHSTALEWAIDALRGVPVDTIAAVYPPAAFTESLERFRRSVRENAVPIDSARRFYQAFALRARDGLLTAEELAELGPYFGLAVPVRYSPPTPSSPSDTTTPLPED